MKCELTSLFFVTRMRLHGRHGVDQQCDVKKRKAGPTHRWLSWLPFTLPFTGHDWTNEPQRGAFSNGCSGTRVPHIAALKYTTNDLDATCSISLRLSQNAYLINMPCPHVLVLSR